ncbi:MAG: sulfatase family protein [Candidatus Binatia bacterium]
MSRIRWVAVVAVACGGAFGAWQLVGGGGARPNVLLITLDTLRADRLGCYGGPAGTPHIDRLAAEGTLFEDAVCPMPMTRPAHFSIFTTLAPRQHGVVHNAASLPADVTTLPEVLREAGYATAGFASVWLLNLDSGVARGFDHFDAPAAGGRGLAADLVQRATAWLQQRAGGAPFFLWVHIFDPHLPYEPPAAFVPPAESAALAQVTQVSWWTLSTAAEQNGGDLSAPMFERAKALYDGEIRATDAAVGALLDGLRASGTLDDTVVALTADHGECFEHGIFFEHATCLYEGAARVPLIVRYPPAVPAGVRRRGLVEHVEIAPALLALAGVDVPEAFGTRGVFAADDRDRFTVVQHPLPLPEVVEHRRHIADGLRSVAGVPVVKPTLGEGRYAVRSRDWKLLIVPGAADVLYDLRADPAEVNDVAARHPDVVGRARSALVTWLRDHPVRGDGAELPISPEFRERLRMLGYDR